MIRILAIIDTLLMVLLILIFIYMYQQERKGHTEMMDVLKQIRDNDK